VPGSLIIRSLVPPDRLQWEPLWAGYNAFYERVIPAEVTDATWGRFFDEGEPVHALVAERDGALVGFTHYLFHRSTSLVARTCYLQDLFTRAEARGGGVGRSLIEAVYGQARAAGAPRVYWLTHETNAPAMKLYDQVAKATGFVQYAKGL